jgi:hypothetical protein
MHGRANFTLYYLLRGDRARSCCNETMAVGARMHESITNLRSLVGSLTGAVKPLQGLVFEKSCPF